VAKAREAPNIVRSEAISEEKLHIIVTTVLPANCPLVTKCAGNQAGAPAFFAFSDPAKTASVLQNLAE
jgi:hypothetical protein